jgi:hypothetical protein
MFDDVRAARLRGVGEAAHIPADVHPGALLEQQAAVVAARSDLVAQLRPGHDARVAIDVRGEQRLAAHELVVVRGLRRELELAASHEIAIDRLFFDQTLDHVDARVERLIEPVRQLGADTLRQHRVVLREAVVAHAAVAARRGVPDGAGFAHHHTRALLRERERGRRTGDPAAHDRHVAHSVRQLRRAAREGLGRIEPIGTETHHALHCRPHHAARHGAHCSRRIASHRVVSSCLRERRVTMRSVVTPPASA